MNLVFSSRSSSFFTVLDGINFWTLSWNVERKTFNPFDICNKACLLTQVKEKHLKQVHSIGLSGSETDTKS